MIEMDDENSEEIQEKTKIAVFNMLRTAMRPEFINRLDEIIMFKPLSKKEMRKIAQIQFVDIQKRLADSGIVLEASTEVLNHLADKGYNPSFGARPLKRILQKDLLNSLSKEILSGRIKKDSVVGIMLNSKNKIEFFNVEKIRLENE